MSDIVTRETVGEFVFKDPLARAAVIRGIPKDIFIRMLLEQCEHLHNQLVVLETSRAYPSKIAATREDDYLNAIREHEKRSRKYYGDHGTIPPQRDLDLWKVLESVS